MTAVSMKLVIGGGARRGAMTHNCSAVPPESEKYTSLPTADNPLTKPGCQR